MDMVTDVTADCYSFNELTFSLPFAVDTKCVYACTHAIVCTAMECAISVYPEIGAAYFHFRVTFTIYIPCRNALLSLTLYLSLSSQKTPYSRVIDICFLRAVGRVTNLRKEREESKNKIERTYTYIYVVTFLNRRSPSNACLPKAGVNVLIKQLASRNWRF